MKEEKEKLWVFKQINKVSNGKGQTHVDQADSLKHIARIFHR